MEDHKNRRRLACLFTHLLTYLYTYLLSFLPIVFANNVNHAHAVSRGYRKFVDLSNEYVCCIGVHPYPDETNLCLDVDLFRGTRVQPMLVNVECFFGCSADVNLSWLSYFGLQKRPAHVASYKLLPFKPLFIQNETIQTTVYTIFLSLKPFFCFSRC